MKRMVAVDDPTTLVGMTLDEYTGTLPDQVRKGPTATQAHPILSKPNPPTHPPIQTKHRPRA